MYIQFGCPKLLMLSPIIARFARPRTTLVANASRLTEFASPINADLDDDDGVRSCDIGRVGRSSIATRPQATTMEQMVNMLERASVARRTIRPKPDRHYIQDGSLRLPVQ